MCRVPVPGCLAARKSEPQCLHSSPAAALLHHICLPATTAEPLLAQARRGPSASITSLSSMMSRGLGLGLRSKSSPAVAEDAQAARLQVARCTGNWLSHLDWGGERWWTLAEEPAIEWQPAPAPLPSDCRFRQDLALLAAGDVKGAQAAKEALEQRQRADAKLRKEGQLAGA